MKDLYALFRQSLAGLRLLLAATLLLGVAYPLLVTGVAQVVAPWRAHGSLVTATGEHTTDADEAVGSELIGQLVDDPALFQPRPSAAGDGYDTLSTYGSNLGPENPDLIAAIKERQAEIADREGVARLGDSRRTPSPRRARASTRTSRWSTPSCRCRGWPPPTVSARSRCAIWSTRTPTAATSACSASRTSTCCCSTSPSRRPRTTRE